MHTSLLQLLSGIKLDKLKKPNCPHQYIISIHPKASIVSILNENVDISIPYHTSLLM